MNDPKCTCGNVAAQYPWAHGGTCDLYTPPPAAPVMPQAAVTNCTNTQPQGWACTREDGHEGPCAVVQNQPRDFPPPAAPVMPNLSPQPAEPDWEQMFNGFGSNWRWGSVDYRGAARVHTFLPMFSDSGRVTAPRKGASCPVEAFNMEVLPVDWQPITVHRDMRTGAMHMLPTDRFGVQLPTGADPVDAADVVMHAQAMPVMAPPPPPANFQAAIPCDKPFMDYVVFYRLVGSRVTCNPPPLDTDQDVLCMVYQENRQAVARSMKADGFVAEGSWPTDTQSDPSNSSVFESMRKGSMNYIITSDEDFYKRFNAATELAKKLNIMTKAGRIELFQAVLYGNAP